MKNTTQYKSNLNFNNIFFVWFRSVLFFVTFLFVISGLTMIVTGSVKAQTCAGSYTSQNLYECRVNLIVGGYICPCAQNKTETYSCGWNSFWGGCYAAEYVAEDCPCSSTQCAAYNRLDTLTTDGCSIVAATNTPTPPATPVSTATPGPTPTPGPTATPPPGPSPTPTDPGGVWWGCENHAACRSYDSQSECEADALGGVCSEWGCPSPCNTEYADRAFMVFEDLNGNGVWDAGEPRISSTETCSSANSQFAAGFNFSIAGSNYSLTANCNIGESEYTGPICTGGSLDCGYESCNQVWGPEWVQVDRSCFSSRNCDSCSWNLRCDFGQANERGFVCNEDWAFCNPSSARFLKSGPMLKLRKVAGTYSVTLNLPTGWTMTPGHSATRNVSFNNSNCPGNSPCCGDLVSFGVVQAPNCSIDYPDGTYDPYQIVSYPPSSYEESSGTINNVSFVSDNPSSVQITPPPTGSGSLTANLGTSSPGVANLSITATMDDGVTQCFDTATINVNNPPAWWQVYGGSLWANNGSISSQVSPIIPGGAYLLEDLNTIVTAGVAAATSSVIEPNPVSALNRRSTGVTPANISNYSFSNYYERLGSPTTTNATNTLGACNTFRDFDYELCYSANDFSVESVAAIDLGTRKVILLVDGNLTINNTINLTRGLGFFLAIAAGDIIVSETIGSPATYPPVATPHLEGLFLAFDDFVVESTNNDDDLQIRIRGSVVALDERTITDDSGIALNRSLADNTAVPAEVFEFAPDLTLRFPRFLSPRQVTWREIAP